MFETLFEKFGSVKYKIVFLMKEYKTMNVVLTKVLKRIPENQIVNVGKKAFKVDFDFPSYITKTFKVYFMNYELGSQMLFSEIEKELNPEELQLIVNTKIISELTKGVLDNFKDKILWIVMGFLIGGLLGYLIADMLMQQKIDDFYEKYAIFDLTQQTFKPYSQIIRGI